MRCDEALEAISAAADGELTGGRILDQLEEHLRVCGDCAGFERTVNRVRSQLRFEPVDALPALGGAARPPAGPAKAPPRSRAPVPGPVTASGGMGTTASGRRHHGWGRWRPVAAAAAVGMVVGATFAGLGRQPQAPAAADLAERVLTAQHEIVTLDAEFELTEVGRRTFDGRLSYSAPESVVLTLTETGSTTRTAAAGDVQLVVDDDRWSLDAVRACASCRTGASPWHQTVIGREPFSEAAPVPLELVTAVDSFALTGSLPQLGVRRIAGHDAVGVQVPAAQVARFLDALSPAGDLRSVYPTDPVDVWLEPDHLVPLAVEVRADRTPERAQWAASRSYADQPGDRVLVFTVRTVDINEEPGNPPPTRRPDRDLQGRVRGDGFRPGDASVVPEPRALPQGLRPHATGTVTTPDGPEVGVRSWTDGRAWVKVRATEEWDRPRLFGEVGAAVRVVDLGDAGQGYLSADGRKVALHSEDLDLVVTGSLPTAALRSLAASLGVVGQPIPVTWPEAATATLGDAEAAQPRLLVARDMDGFAPPAVRVADGVVTQVYAGPGDRLLVVTQSTTPDLSPPAARDSLGVQVRGRPGRYSVERGELEWTDGRASFSLTSSSLSLAELVAVAEGLEPA